jgi:UDP-N-acetylmuramoyl-tripeptide--D-alanyl-D-alanine ligase
MIPLTLAELADATGGRLNEQAAAQARVTGPVVADSRLVRPGALFVALPGERVDGHDYAAAAVAAGAVAVLAGREVGVPAVIVDDPLLALGRLARAVLDRLPAVTVIGVTGSSGKTSTKDLLAALLADAGPTVAPLGSFNNELGLPLTALGCDAATRYLVAEMGAREPGNISYLCTITPPRVAVVLNVGAAHAGIFGSREVTARAKGELAAALPPDGVAVLNADDAAVRGLPAPAGVRVVLFGRATDAQVRADDVRLDERARAAFTLVAGGERAGVTLRLHGEHNVSNALAAAAVGLQVGLGVQRVAKLLSSAAPASRWRMDVHTSPGAVVVVNDAYNANPDSMRAALRALAVMGRGGADQPGRTEPGRTEPRRTEPRRTEPRRTWAVLGEMLELGDDSPGEHEAIGRALVDLDISRLVAVGEGAARVIHRGAVQNRSDRSDRSDGTRAAWVPDQEAAFALLQAELRPGDIVLVKASRSVGLDALATRLLSEPARPDGVPVPVRLPPAGEDGARIGGPAAEPDGEGMA